MRFLLRCLHVALSRQVGFSLIHPVASFLWETREMRELLADPRVHRARIPRCAGTGRSTPDFYGDCWLLSSASDVGDLDIACECGRQGVHSRTFAGPVPWPPEAWWRLSGVAEPLTRIVLRWRNGLLGPEHDRRKRVAAQARTVAVRAAGTESHLVLPMDRWPPMLLVKQWWLQMWLVKEPLRFAAPVVACGTDGSVAGVRPSRGRRGRRAVDRADTEGQTVAPEDWPLKLCSVKGAELVSAVDQFYRWRRFGEGCSAPSALGPARLDAAWTEVLARR